MLTRSKQRALDAEFKSADLRRSEEGPSLGLKVPADWSELPAEMLMMIFENLTIEPRSSKEQRKPLLNCRLVHPRWKSAMDDLLEQRSLSFWKKWNQPNLNPYKFPVVHFNSDGKNTLQNIVFPFLQGNIENCPFPTKSVCLTSDQDCGDNWVLSPRRDDHFFSRYGSHLTSLTIEEINGRKDFTTQILQQLLSCTPHLKAMTLKHVKIKMLEKDVGKLSLPPLLHLEHVRLLGVWCRGFYFDVQKWILEFYMKQLTSVVCVDKLGCKNSPACFPLLKQLQLRWPNPRQLLAPVALPSLKRADLFIRLNGSERINLEHVFKFLSAVASTLIELRLDLIDRGRSKANPINYEKDKSLQELKKIQKSRFSTLKTLTIFYPKYEEEVKVIKDFLKMFPNLQTLNFTRFDSKDLDPTKRQRTKVRKHLDKEKYQGVCPKLMKINVYMVVEPGRRPFFTSQFPFPT